MGISSVANGGGGIKRKADESNLSDELRFAKRFNLLNIDAEQRGNSNFYIPVSKHATHALPNGQIPEQDTTCVDESMQVDDTRDRIYIHDLDEELASEEPEEEKLIFLPDIERYFSKIPQQMLQGRREDDNEGKELVLYSIPRSLAVDEEHDNVRRAIIESRQRAREKAAEEARQLDMDCKYGQASASIPTETAHGYSAGYNNEVLEDEDAMDMD